MNARIRNDVWVQQPILQRFLSDRQTSRKISNTACEKMRRQGARLAERCNYRCDVRIPRVSERQWRRLVMPFGTNGRLRRISNSRCIHSAVTG